MRLLPSMAVGDSGNAMTGCGWTVIHGITSESGGCIAQMKLNLPRRTKRRLIRPMQPLDAPLWPNEIWSLDFMSDSLYQGRRFRTLNILDEGVREALAIEIDTSLPAQRVVRVLQQLEGLAWIAQSDTARQWPGTHCQRRFKTDPLFDYLAGIKLTHPDI